MEFCEGKKDPWCELCVEYSSKNRKRSADLMFMLGLNEDIDQLAMASSVC